MPDLISHLQASARRVGLKRLFDWVLSVMSLSLVPWRLVIGRLGRIGHGELRGWSTLLSRKSLKKAIKQLKVRLRVWPERRCEVFDVAGSVRLEVRPAHDTVGLPDQPGAGQRAESDAGPVHARSGAGN